MYFIRLEKREWVLRGFTFIEAVMVIVILGILVVVANPRFEIFYELKIRSAAKKIISDIRYTQSLAMSQHEDYAVSFDIYDDSYRVYRISDNTTAKDPFSKTDLVVDFDNENLYKGINIVSVDFDTTNVLRFNWEGTPYDGNGDILNNTGMIVLRYKGKNLTVYIAPQTGRVSWQ